MKDYLQTAKKIQSRIRSKAAWVSLLPVLLILGDTYGLWDIIHMPKNIFVQLLATLGAALNAWGVFNNPTNPDGF